jgi:multicomponent Na+:H+ antiporter subunit E
MTILGINFILWLLLVGDLNSAEVIAGLIVATVATILVLEKSSVFSGLNFNLAMPLSLLAYLVVFLVALVRANLDMAFRVLSPSLPLRPGMVRVRTSLQSDLGKLILANSITLTPGTLSVDVIGDEILVHWIDCPEDCDSEMATRAIAASFEKHLKGFLK